MGWSDAYGLNGSSPALIVIEAHSPATELLAKNPVLLAKIVNDQQLALVHPPGDGDQHEPEWVENTLCIQSSLSRPPGCGRKPSQIHADPVFGPHGVSPDPITYVLVPIALLLIILAACYIPARRASLIDSRVAVRINLGALSVTTPDA